MTTTQNMNLELLEGTDNFNTDSIKANFEKIDEQTLIPNKIVDNCVTDNSNLPLSAKQGKELQNQITQLNGNLGKKVQVPSVDGKYSLNAYMNIDNWGWIEVENTEAREVSRLQFDTQGTALQLLHKKGTNNNYSLIKNFLVYNEYWGGLENIELEANVWKRCQKFISMPKGQYMLVWHAKLNPGQPKREVCMHIVCEPSNPMLELYTSFSSMDYFDALHTSSCFINVGVQTHIYIDLLSTVSTEVKEVEICAIKLT